jgi:hypothetical protein
MQSPGSVFRIRQCFKERDGRSHFFGCEVRLRRSLASRPQLYQLLIHLLRILNNDRIRLSYCGLQCWIEWAVTIGNFRAALVPPPALVLDRRLGKDSVGGVKRACGWSR